MIREGVSNFLGIELRVASLNNMRDAAVASF
jgi:hypothetical protein